MDDPAETTSPATDERLEVVVDIREDMGSEVFVHFAVDAPPVVAEELEEIVGGEALAAADEQTHHHGSPFIARIGRGSSAREGEKISLAVSTRHLHFFDLATGEGIYAHVA
jgi:multiple sugar transport system ATP-binding protein